MLIEIHMIQNHSPANMNRDDLGAPKTCLFGGVPRARISSQCLKRSIRAPRNPDDVHNRGGGMFAESMAAYIGCRTKFFPWLVEQALKDSQIPADEHRRIVLAVQRIAAPKEKEPGKTDGRARSDPRPKTPQLIHLGPGHAKHFVDSLAELRTSNREAYGYFLDPVARFQEAVRDLLSDSELPEKDQEQIAKVSWVIATCRMQELLKENEGDEAEDEPEKEDGQPGMLHAIKIVERLVGLFETDKKRFKKLTQSPTQLEKDKIKEQAPEKPKQMTKFMEALQAAYRYDAVDIAMFGRMTTSEAFQDVEAAMQVAHAISTHAVINETDYFTAVDDLAKTGGGAGHVDEAMYNSACFYKYFSLDWDQLIDNLSGPEPDEDKDPAANKKWKEEVRPHAEKLAAATVGHFLRAAARTSPAARQNSFASHCDPCGILVEIKQAKIPTSYANAFAEPVTRIGAPERDTVDESSVEGRSVACLADHVQALRDAYGENSTLLWYSPKLWRFPLQYCERNEDGSLRKDESGARLPAKLVTDKRFSSVERLVEAMVGELKLSWSEVRGIGSVDAVPRARTAMEARP